jgi:hypothetical protein
VEQWSPDVRLALLLPDGVGVRNFLFGAFLRQAEAKGPVSILHVIPDELLPVLAGQCPPTVQWHRLVPSQGGRLESTLRSSLSYAHMYRVSTTAMRRRLARPVSTPTLGRWAVTQTARLVGRTAASSTGIALLERWHGRIVERDPAVAHYRQLFLRNRPDVLFCSHQRPMQIAAPVAAARALGIPTVTFIFSWDNLCSKGRIAAPFDHYLVWSEHMATELVQHYPEISPSAVHVVGTPQFDPYGDPSMLWPREEFFRRIEADAGRPLICYSGGDRGTCPEDAAHLGMLLGMVRDGRIAGRPQVVLRPSPVDDGSRYQDVLREFPELRYAAPAWHHPEASDWSRVIPLPEDVPFLANLTHHCDLNVNTASTMTLDFAARDKPVVNIAFDVATPPPLGVPLFELYYQYEHYRPVIELGAARIARSPAQLAEHVNAYLADPRLDREGRRRLLELELDLPLGRASSCALEALERIVSLPARVPRRGATR